MQKLEVVVVLNFIFIYRLDKTLRGSSKISSRALVDLLLTFVGLGFEVVEDFAEESLKISSR